LDAVSILANSSSNVVASSSVEVSLEEDGQANAQDAALIPTEYSLSQNYPNPYNPTTQIQYALPVRSNVLIAIYDVTGKEVARVVQGMRDAGTHEERFSGSALPSGVYVYRLMATSENGGRFTAVKKMVLLK
jgi:hypothetical protein